MKSGTVDGDRFKVEGRQSLHRRKMSKGVCVFNGGESPASTAAVIARQVNLAYHDHVSYTKSSAEPCKKKTCETDHIYANCSEVKSGKANVNTKDLALENMQLRDMILSHLDMISQLHEELDKKSKQVYDLIEGNEKLVAHRERKMWEEGRVPPVLATRYFGRKSKTIPSRALKRRYLGPPKLLLPRQQGGGRRGDFLTTDRDYFLPDRKFQPEGPPTPHIDVPLWKLKPVTSFYQMEGTENINDPVFERRHQKYELDERRRKRWDLQRLREQRASERLRQRREQEEPPSFYPHPRQVECIDVTDQLPVLAFGHLIPLFQPCEFSLPWCEAKARRGRPCVT